MAKYHVNNETGAPGVCNAKPGNCPVNRNSDNDPETEHYSSSDAARAGFEKIMESKDSVQGVKKADPDTEHIRAANKKIAAMEADLKARDARQFTNTAYQQILKEVSKEEFDAMTAVITTDRQAGIGYLQTSDGADLVVGVSYSADHRNEEEEGIAAISEGLNNGTYKKEDVEFIEKAGKAAFIIKGKSFYINDEDTKQNLAIATKRLNDYLSFNTRRSLWNTEDKLIEKKIPELREMLKGKVKPLPTKRQDLVKAIYLQENPSAEGEIKVPQGEFQSGKVLAIVSDNKAMIATMRKAKEAHDAGSLRAGRSSNPFSNGIVFYDERDVSRAGIIKNVKEAETNRLADENIVDTVSKLKENGMVYYAGSDTSDNVENLKDARYWLNYSPNKKPEGLKDNSRQISGWFNREQLARIANSDYTPLHEKEKEEEAWQKARKLKKAQEDK